jgi:hypothetical protein
MRPEIIKEMKGSHKGTKTQRMKDDGEQDRQGELTGSSSRLCAFV